MTAPAAVTRPRRGPWSPWVLPEDGIVDPIAVELAATGQRRVPLTPGERLAVAASIIARGGTPYVIGLRLHCNSVIAHALADTARRTALATIQPGEWACQRCGAAHFGTEPEDGLCGDCRGAGAAA